MAFYLIGSYINSIDDSTMCGRQIQMYKKT